VTDAGRDVERMQDYMVGRLSDDEHRAFEDRLVRDPGLVREFEQSLRLSEGLHQLRAQGHFDKAASEPEALGSGCPSWQRPRSPDLHYSCGCNRATDPHRF